MFAHFKDYHGNHKNFKSLYGFGGRCLKIRDVCMDFEVIYQKTSASVSSGVPNTEKQMKARGRRPSAFIVSRCLEPVMKHEARVFGLAS